MFHLTKEGIPYGTIILGSRATWLDRHAAEELRSYVKKLSGATLLITHERYASSIEGGKILIGRASTSDIVGRLLPIIRMFCRRRAIPKMTVSPMQCGETPWSSAAPTTALYTTASAICCKRNLALDFTGIGMCLKRSVVFLCRMD